MQALLQFTRDEYAAWVADEKVRYELWATGHGITSPQYANTLRDNPLADFIGTQMHWTPATEMQAGVPVAVFTEYETDTELVLHLPAWTREIIERIPPQEVVYGPPAVQTEYGLMHDLTAGTRTLTTVDMPVFPLFERLKRTSAPGEDTAD